MTSEEQEKMQQSIEKQQKTKSTQNSVTVMFHDRNGFLAVIDSFRAGSNAASSLSDDLMVGVPDVSPVPPLSSSVKVRPSRARSRHRTRRRTWPHIEKFSAEGPVALSALAVLAVNPNKRGTQADATVTTTMTEQRRCAAA